MKQASMKAAVCRQYGPPEVVRIEAVGKPAPKDDEVLIKIRATTVTSGDCRVRSLTTPPGFGLIARLFFGVFKPRRPILGSELAGEIEAVGKDVTRFKVGDQVFAFPGVDLSSREQNQGCHAEYRTMPENGQIAAKPANLSFEEAAALSFGGATALRYLRDKGRIEAGEKALIIGASGCVGSAAVQLAKHFGAHVTGVCGASNLELVRSIGADRAIDYTHEDYTQGGETYNLIFDTVGDATFAKCETLLKPGGRRLLVVADLPQMLGAALRPRRHGKEILAGHAKVTTDDLLALKRLAETGQFKPVIDQCYRLDQIVEAHARVDTGRKRGSVVVRVGRDDRL